MMGTGAFTSVQADRTMEVEVADDSSAYLTLVPDTDLGNNAYASYDGAGKLEIDIGGNGAGSGANEDALTVIDNVFEIRNKGTQEIEVYIELSSNLIDYVDFYAIAGSTGSSVNGGERSIVGASNAFSGAGFGSVGGGNKLLVGVEIDLRDDDAPDSAEDLDGTVTVFADTV